MPLLPLWDLMACYRVNFTFMYNNNNNNNNNNKAREKTTVDDFQTLIGTNNQLTREKKKK